MKKVFAVTAGGVIAAVLQFLAVNFKLEALTPLASSILVALAWVLSHVIHTPNAQGKTGLSKLFAVLALMIFVPSLVSAQRAKTTAPPHKSLRASIAAADSAVDSSQFKVEFGSDLRALKTGDSLPADVRIGYVVSNTFTVEASVAAQQDSSTAQGNYIEADVALGVTASLFPGSTNYHGQFVFASPVLHYEGSSFQYGVKFGTGTRQVASTSAGMLARISAGMQHLFARDLLPAKNEAFVEVGVSFLK